AQAAGTASEETLAGPGTTVAPPAEESGYRITWQLVDSHQSTVNRGPSTADGGLSTVDRRLSARSWIVCVDRRGVGARIVERLVSSGQRCVAIERPASATGQEKNGGSESDERWERDLRAAVTATPAALVLCLWHLDAGEGGTAGALADAVSV